MAEKTTIVLIDDIDRGPASRTVAFTLDEINYEIGLNVTHANELREDFRHWTEAGRQVQGRRRRGTSTQIDYAICEYSHKMRKWALERGIDVNDRGRVPSSIMEQYERKSGK